MEAASKENGSLVSSAAGEAVGQNEDLILFSLGNKEKQSEIG